MLVGPAIRSLEPNILHCYERDVVGFQVNDCTGGETARGDYPDVIPGVVRPLMKWATEYEPADEDILIETPPGTLSASAGAPEAAGRGTGTTGAFHHKERGL